MEKISYKNALDESKIYFDDELSAKVFIDKYALRDNDNNLLEKTPDDMHKRIAKELYRIEKNKFKNPMSYDEIYSYLKDFKYIIPQGSNLSGIGNTYKYVSLSNCFVIKSPLDSYSAICKADEEIVNIAKRRGGTGLDISNLRPKGMSTSNASKTSTGIVPFCERYSNSIREVGQCLYGTTKILTYNGIKNIQDVKKDEKVWTKEGWIKIENKIKNKKSCLKIKTSHGKEIICSKDHVFHTINGEKKIEELNKGDSVTQIIGEGWKEKNNLEFKSHSYPYILDDTIKLPNKIDSDFTYLIGFLYEKGYINEEKGYIDIISNNIDYKEKLTRIINKNFKLEVFEEKNKITFYSKSFIKFLKDNNIFKKEKINFFDILFKLDKDKISSFLLGYLNANKCFSGNKKNTLLNIQNILSSFGIISTIIKEDENTIKNIYNLVIITKEKFKELIKYNEDIKIDYKQRKTYNEKVEYTINDIESVSDLFYLKDEDVFIKYSDDNEFLYQDKISSIEEYKDGEEQEVYDLCLEKEHFFFANGLYVHNSGRRGALIITLSVHHPEIMNFIEMKRDLNKVTGANISVKLTDNFLNAVKKDEEYEQRWPIDSDNPTISKMVKAKDIWNEIINGAWLSAEPGVLMWDRIIEESPADCYSDFGYKTVSTNPCIVGDTKISTNQGDISIFEIIDNGIENYKVKTYNEKLNKIELEDIIFGEKTKENTDIIEIEMEDGEKLQLTPDHKVYTKNRGYIEAAFLNEDDIILKLKKE